MEANHQAVIVSKQKVQGAQGVESSGAVVKGVEHISSNLFVNIWVARVRVPLVLSVGIWICKNSIINT